MKSLRSDFAHITQPKQKPSTVLICVASVVLGGVRSNIDTHVLTSAEHTVIYFLLFATLSESKAFDFIMSETSPGHNPSSVLMEWEVSLPSLLQRKSKLFRYVSSVLS